jgi:small subunit ribosomal protein S5
MNQNFREIDKRQQDGFEESLVQVDRVTRVSAGGKRLRFRATLVVGNRNGKVGIASAKATEVSEAVKKAAKKARKNIITVPIINETIPHRIQTSFGAAKIILKPAPRGSGIIAGGAIRVLAELAGIKNLSSKILGTQNKLNNLKAGIKALQSFLPKSLNQDAKHKEQDMQNIKSQNKKDKE